MLKSALFFLKIFNEPVIIKSIPRSDSEYENNKPGGRVGNSKVLVV